LTSRIFSDDFIKISSDTSVKDAFDLIKELKPDYVIVDRKEGSESLYYVFLTNLLQHYLHHCLENNQDPYSDTIKDFLILRELDLDYTHTNETPILDTTDDPQLKEINSLATDNQFIVLNHDEQILGILDPIKGKKNSVYEIKGKQYQVSSSKFEPKGRGVRGQKRVRRTPKAKGVKSGTRTVKKYANASLSNKIPLGKPAKFKIVIKPSESKTTKPETLDINSEDFVIIAGKKEKETSFMVVAKSDPPNFIEFTDGFAKEMKVPLTKKDSKPLVFNIKPKKEGFCIIQADFFHKNLHLGQIRIKTKVTTAQESSTTTKTTSSIEMNATEGGSDLLLIIRDNPDSRNRQFDIIVRAVKLNIALKTFKTEPLNKNLEEYCNNIIQQIDDYGYEDEENPDAPLPTVEQIEENAKNKGKYFYSKIFTPEFQQFFWKNRNKIKSIQIISHETSIPWEIIKPYNETDEDEFWCEKYAISRWYDGIDTKQKSTINSIKVIQPKDTNLTGAKEEVKWISRFAKEAKVKVLTPPASTNADVLKSLKEGGFDLLHISTHGHYSEKNPDSSIIEVYGEQEFFCR